MRIFWLSAMVFAIVCLSLSCGPQPPDVQFVRQKIPVEIQKGKPLTIEIQSLSGNGINDVGIRCAPEIWKTLTNGLKVIEVRLKSSSKPDTQISRVDPGGRSAFLMHITNVHYLFDIAGSYRAKASVELMFPNAPPEVTRAEVIVGKTPADTGL